MDHTVPRDAAVRRVLLFTLGLNVLVAVGKIAYGTWTHTLAVRADGFHSLTDGANNVVGLVGVHLASRPADDDHPYGHEKLETLASGVVGLSLLAMAYDVLQKAYQRWSTGGIAPRVDTGLIILLVLTLLVNIYVSSYERRRGEQLKSTFLLSDAAHTRSDVFVTLGVIASVICVKFGYPQVDVVAAIVVAAFIAWAGIDVVRSNVGYLADVRALDPNVVERCVLGVPGVASTHKIRTRGAPGAIHVDLHIQIARHLNVVEAHQVTHWVIEAIRRDVPGVMDVLVHTEPAAPDQPCNPMP